MFVPFLGVCRLKQHIWRLTPLTSVNGVQKLFSDRPLSAGAIFLPAQAALLKIFKLSAQEASALHLPAFRGGLRRVAFIGRDSAVIGAIEVSTTS